MYLYLRAQHRAGKLAQASASSDEVLSLIRMPGNPAERRIRVELNGPGAVRLLPGPQFSSSCVVLQTPVLAEEEARDQLHARLYLSSEQMTDLAYQDVLFLSQDTVYRCPA